MRQQRYTPIESIIANILLAIVLVCLAACASFSLSLFSSSVGYWANHSIFGGILILLGFAYLPRLTFLILWLVFGTFNLEPDVHSLLGVIGFVLVPRMTAACLGLLTYYGTNPILCVGALIISLIGESAEKGMADRSV
ncbi:MAG: hypothetical protein HC888_02605 [Candidatus Competibacteraceae bacterium]|nr:hypothetical protein [Candidatus Competibacteraceae bacterium]